MKRYAMLVLALASATQLHAQWIPPARDLDEAMKMMTEIGRALEPAMMAVRDEASVLGALSAAQRKLEEVNQPGMAVDEALKPIDEFLQKRKTLDFSLSREMTGYISGARAVIAEANTPPHTLDSARERLHHKFVHPLQTRVIRNAQRLADIEQSYRYVVERQIRPAMADSLNRAGFASAEVGPRP